MKKIMMKTISRIKPAFLAMLVLPLAACQTHQAYNSNSPNYLIDKNHEAVDHLLLAGSGPLNKNVPVIVATLVDIDKLEETSRLGRVVSEQVATRLSQKGYKPIELKLRDNLFIRQNGGEFLLSREIKDIAASHKTESVIVGTYSPSDSYVYINLKVIDTKDNTVRAAHDYALPRSGCIGTPDYPCNVVRSLLNSTPYAFPESAMMPPVR